MLKYSARYWITPNQYVVGSFYSTPKQQPTDQIYFVYAYEGSKSLLLLISQLESIGQVIE